MAKIAKWSNNLVDTDVNTEHVPKEEKTVVGLELKQHLFHFHGLRSTKWY